MGVAGIALGDGDTVAFCVGDGVTLTRGEATGPDAAAVRQTENKNKPGTIVFIIKMWREQLGLNNMDGIEIHAHTRSFAFNSAIRACSFG